MPAAASTLRVWLEGIGIALCVGLNLALDVIRISPLPEVWDRSWGMVALYLAIHDIAARRQPP